MNNQIFAANEEANTTVATGENQIIVSPMNILLDLDETASANAIVLDRDGAFVEGITLMVVSQDKTKLKIIDRDFITSESGSIEFSLLGKAKGDFIITVSDGSVSTHINVAVKDLIRYVLPYFYGDMQISLINPTNFTNYVKIQFHENSDRDEPPLVVRLNDKEMVTLRLSEELDSKLTDGWVELFATEILVGGTWTNKGYLSFDQIHAYQ
ncbi:MAG: hypothetical protein SCALA701_14660 [Candidatus Scalindua sp.]|nr:hypothetical protein [Planctomycetota bacterium]RZV77595.1 MAG: hypothetical protein EX341_11855 [Candidatus Scalindua sp. SCAELEC01]GJQ58665.1 MAG: hypothetical protein SCALA701_14660 [Candidatus Scalindua sp.]